MAQFDPRSTGRQRSIAGLGLLLVGGAAFAAASGSDVVTCATLQQPRISEQAPWRCQIVLEANRAYIAEVARQTRDVTLELIGPDSKRILKVNSPTRRAGPELLFHSPRVTGKYTLVLDVVDRGVPARIVELQVREISEVAPNSARARGMAALTTAAAVTNQTRADDPQRRIATLKSALPPLRAVGAHELEAETLFRTANIYYWDLNDWTNAAASADEATRAFDRVPDPIMSTQATTVRAWSMIESAGPVQTGAKPAAKPGRTQFDDAEQLLEKSVRQFKSAGMKYEEASVINYLGVLSDYQGRSADARTHYVAAARIFAELGEPASEVQSLQNIAVLDFERGDYVEAVKAYQRQLTRLDPVRNRRTYLAILNNLAVAQYALGYTDEALKNLLTALPLTEGSAELSDRARTLHWLGRTYLTLGEHERGEVFLEQALELRQSDAVRDRQGLLLSLINNANQYREKGATQRALKLHTQALDHAVSPQERLLVLLAMGKDHMAAGSLDAAIETYLRALKLDLPEGTPTRVSVTGAYGYALSRQGNPEGRALLLKAAQAHETAGDEDLAAEDYYWLASEERRTGQLDSALRNVDRALTIHNAQRIRAVNPDLRATFISNRAAAYELQAGLYMALWERTSSPAEKDRLASAALGSAELLRLRALDDFRQFAQSSSTERNASDADALVELDARLAAKRHRLAAVLDQDNPSGEQVASLRREIALLRTELDVAQQKHGSKTGEPRAEYASLSVLQLQRSLAKDVVLLTWLLGEERSWVWCITREAAAAFPLAAGDDVEAAARELHGLWSRPSAGASNRESELKASRTILGPAGTIVSQKRAITIVTDGALRAIPFGALWLDRGDKNGPQRLAESATVSYQPALNHWRRSAVMSGKVEDRQRILLVGDPVLIGAPDAPGEVAELRGAARANTVPQFRRLPGSRREVNSIVRIAANWHSDVLLGEAATKARVLAMPLGTFRVLHFATHARLDVHDPQLSSIVLSTRPTEVGQNESALSLREIVGLGLKADAVVLSACEGSLGKEYRGQLSFGLSEAFLLAGARNVLGSLWRVSDVATEKYMQSFYQHYINRGLTSIAAAQAATREMMSDRDYSHPFYWAAFVVLAP